MTGTAIILLVNVLTSIFKRWIYPKFGVVGVQFLVFLLALLGAVYYTYGKDIVSVQTVVNSTIAIFSLSVAFYEVILQHLPVFKGPEVVE